MNQTIINAIKINPDNLAFYLSILVSVCVVALMVRGGKSFFKGMQQRGYHSGGYLNYIHSKGKKFLLRLALACLLSTICYVTFCVVFAPFAVNVLQFMGLIFFFVFTDVFGATTKKERASSRQKIEYTARLKRLQATYSVIYFALSFVTLYEMNMLHMTTGWGFLRYARYFPICLFPITMPYVVLVANFINSPFEKLNIARYARKAKEILEKNKVKVIAVTGSFGKTTTKDIIASLLGTEYIVASAPNSYNTPSGVALTVNNYVTEKTQYVVLEMGARKAGDIAYLCKFARPDYSVITSVGAQHMATFKTVENVAKTKNELVLNTKKSGVAFFNCDCDGAKELFDNASIKKYCSGSVDCDLNFNILKVDRNGSQFEVAIDGGVYEFKTQLLGTHNVANICLGILVAHKIGVEIDVLQKAVAKLEATPHRLQLIENEHAIVIDDSYNSNIKGAEFASEVLGMFEGRKIVVTPGLVELGKMEKEANEKLGKTFAGVCDRIILVGAVRAEDISRGIAETGYDMDNVIVFENFEEARNSLHAIMRNGDVVLFENDIPDCYL